MVKTIDFLHGSCIFLRMTQEIDLDSVIRQRIRALRQSNGWSLDSLAKRAGLSVSTLSRIETGNRRIALDQLVPIARSLGTTLDELVAPADGKGVIIGPEPITVPGMTMWKLSDDDAVNGVVVTKIRFDPEQHIAPTEARVHPGKEWFTVLSGEIQLTLGDRVFHVKSGQAAQFDTMTPHVIRAIGGVSEVVSMMDSAGTRAHHDDGRES